MPTNTNGYQYYYPPNNNQPYSQPVLLDPRFDLIIQHLSQLEQHQLNKKEQAALAEGLLHKQHLHLRRFDFRSHAIASSKYSFV